MWTDGELLRFLQLKLFKQYYFERNIQDNTKKDDYIPIIAIENRFRAEYVNFDPSVQFQGYPQR